MRTRKLEKNDVNHIRYLHEKYYSDFEFPDFFDNFFSNFAITDDAGEIIIAGGVRPIAESIIITDQTMSRIKIGKALVEAQKISLYTCRRTGIDELHAFVNNEEYAKHLMQHGFTPRSSAYSMKVF